MHSKIVINGDDFFDLDGFYEVISEKIVKDEDWEIGTLDGFNDVLYGVSGDFIWINSKKSSEDLGFQDTLNFLESKLKIGKPYNVNLISQQKENLLSGKGQTLFEILVEIIEDHQNITLILGLIL